MALVVSSLRPLAVMLMVACASRLGHASPESALIDTMKVKVTSAVGLCRAGRLTLVHLANGCSVSMPRSTAYPSTGCRSYSGGSDKRNKSTPRHACPYPGHSLWRSTRSSSATGFALLLRIYARC